MESRFYPDKKLPVIEGTVVFAVREGSQQESIEPCGCGCKSVEITENSKEAEKPASWPKAEAGIPAFGYMVLSNESRPVAIRRNYGSAQATFDKANACYPGRVVSTTYWNGSIVSVGGPCLICNDQYGTAC